MQLLMINVDNIGKGRLHDSFSLLWCTQHLFFFPLTSIIFFIPYKKCLLSIWSLNINNLISICKIIFNIVYISVIASKLDWNKVPTENVFTNWDENYYIDNFKSSLLNKKWFWWQILNNLYKISDSFMGINVTSH